MLHYSRTKVLEVTASKQSVICHYWCFLDKGFKFQPNNRNGCHDVLMMSM